MNEEEVKCKMLKADIYQMISIIRLNEMGLLQALKDGIINAQADYYYSELVANGLIKEKH